MLLCSYAHQWFKATNITKSRLKKLWIKIILQNFGQLVCSKINITKPPLVMKNSWRYVHVYLPDSLMAFLIKIRK